MDERPGDVLTIEELSAYLKIPKSTLYKLVREGKVPCQKVGRHWRFRKEAIDRWLENLPAVSPAQAGRHAGATKPQDSGFGCTEGRGPGKARVKDGGNE
jgi:excisionase family DNA binding protein